MNPYVCTRHGTPIGNEANQLVVGRTADRASCQADLYGIAMNADALGTRRPGLDMDGQERPALTVPGDDRKGIDGFKRSL